MIGAANGPRIGITGLGVNVPERVVTNEELARHVDTTDEWIVERTGIRERRMASEGEALTDIALPAARAALADAGVDASEIDLLISATVTPDMMRAPRPIHTSCPTSMSPFVAGCPSSSAPGRSSMNRNG